MNSESTVRKINACLVIALLFAFAHYVTMKDRFTAQANEHQRILKNQTEYINILNGTVSHHQEENERLRRKNVLLIVEIDQLKKELQPAGSPASQAPKETEEVLVQGLP